MNTLDATAVVLAILAVLAVSSCSLATVWNYPEPLGAQHSEHYAVEVDGKPIYVQDVSTTNGKSASYAGFDFEGAVEVVVRVKRDPQSVRITPGSFGIRPLVEGRVIRFKLDQPRHLTLEAWAEDHALHLFANPQESFPPDKDDPSVLYFEPGVHEVETLRLQSGQTLYLAGGAVLKCKLAPDEVPTNPKNWAGQKVFANLISASDAKNVSIRGRGVIDMRGLPWHARSGIIFNRCQGVRIEGITLIGAPAWNIATFNCRDVQVENVKLLSDRLNSDGINLCNTQNASIRRCFSRTNDDAFSVKTTLPPPAMESKSIVVEDCVIWNERARGIGITSETRHDISDVTFRNCDIIRDFANSPKWLCAAMAILVSDSGTIRNIRFEDIRIEHSRNTLFRGWIGEDMWGHDPQRGRVADVTLRNIVYSGEGEPIIQIDGHSEAHGFADIKISGLKMRGKSVAGADAGVFKLNHFVQGFSVVAPASAE